MKAVTWHGKRDVRVEEVPDPEIWSPPRPSSKSPRPPSADRTYPIFQEKEQGAIKVVLRL